MKLSEFIVSKDPETFLLGLRSLPEDFYKWCNAYKPKTTIDNVSIFANSYRISQILNSDQVWFEDLSGETLVHYKDRDLNRYCYQRIFIDLIRKYENFRASSSR